MIRRAKIKFIAFMMSIVFAIFAGTYGVFAVISINSRNREILGNLEKVESSFMFDKGPITFEYYVGELGGKNGFTEIAKSKDFPSDVLDEIVSSSLSHSYNAGEVDDYYYKVSNFLDKKIIIIADMSQTISRYHDTMVKLLVVMSVAIVLVFLLVMLISKNLFKPIEDTLINQKKFLSDASHELKTPIAVISANADVIMKNDDSEWINNVKAQTERMKTLVTDLLTLSAIDENNAIKKKVKFSLSDEIIKATLFFDALAFEKGKRIITSVENDIFINGDPDSVRKITEIFIENAIKYATPQTDIIVSLKTVSHKIVMTVYNQGSNVPREDAKKIFERFYRGEKSRSRELGGSGLGLSIAKSLCSLNKWKISANCELNEYMEIRVVFQ